MDRFDLEHHYDILTVYVGPSTNNRAMILHEWTGSDLWNRDLFIPHDRISLVFTTDRSQNASGFLLHYEVIEKGSINSSPHSYSNVSVHLSNRQIRRRSVRTLWHDPVNRLSVAFKNEHGISLEYSNEWFQWNRDQPAGHPSRRPKRLSSDCCW